MGKVRVGGEPVRKFLIDNIDAHPADVVKMASEKFDCSRQAVHKHLKRLVDEGAVLVTGRHAASAIALPHCWNGRTSTKLP
jgi:predicted transcriptional regulator